MVLTGSDIQVKSGVKIKPGYTAKGLEQIGKILRLSVKRSGMDLRGFSAMVCEAAGNSSVLNKDTLHKLLRAGTDKGVKDGAIALWRLRYIAPFTYSPELDRPYTEDELLQIANSDDTDTDFQDTYEISDPEEDEDERAYQRQKQKDDEFDRLIEQVRNLDGDRRAILLMELSKLNWHDKILTKAKRSRRTGARSNKKNDLDKSLPNLAFLNGKAKELSSSVCKDNPLFIAVCDRIREMGIDEFIRQSQMKPNDLNSFLSGMMQPVYALCLSRVLPYTIDEIYYLANKGAN